MGGDSANDGGSYEWLPDNGCSDRHTDGGVAVWGLVSGEVGGSIRVRIGGEYHAKCYSM